VMAAADENSFDTSVLSRRISDMDATEDDVQCILLDAMVPRQRLKIRAGPPFSTLLTRLKNDSKQPLAMLGADLAQQRIMSFGVEARIETLTEVDDEGGVDVVLIGGRRFELLSGANDTPRERLFTGRVRWLRDQMGAGEATKRSEALGPLVGEWLEVRGRSSSALKLSPERPLTHHLMSLPALASRS
jgi:hypothetical protein